MAFERAHPFRLNYESNSNGLKHIVSAGHLTNFQNHKNRKMTVHATAFQLNEGAFRLRTNQLHRF